MGAVRRKLRSSGDAELTLNTHGRSTQFSTWSAAARRPYSAGPTMTAVIRKLRSDGTATLTLTNRNRSTLEFRTWGGVSYALELTPLELGALVLAGQRLLIDGQHDGTPSTATA